MAFLFLLALLDRLALVRFYPFDGLYGQDSYAYYEYALTLFHAIVRFQPPPPFWWPLGYPVLLSASFIFGETIASAQSITLLSGALVAPLAFALAHETAPSPYQNLAAWVAGGICVVGGQLAQSSVVIMADAPALMFTTLAAWLLVRYARTRNLVTLGASSFAVGMSIWTRWQNLIFAIVWLAAFAVVELLFPRDQYRAHAARFFSALAFIALILLPQFMIGSVTNAPLAGQSWLEGWSIGNFIARSFENIDGHFVYPLPVILFYAQVFFHPAYLIALLTPLFGMGVMVLYGQLTTAHHTEPAPRAASVLLIGWIVAMFLFLAGIPYENFRFGLGLFPPVAVATGIGAGWLAHRWKHLGLRYGLAAWIGLSCAVMLVWQPRVLAPVLEIKAQELYQAHWLAARVPPTATLWTMGVNGALETYTNLHVENLWEKSASDLRASAPAYLFIDTQNFETQWRDRQPDQLYRTLTAANALQELDRAEGWTLFLIQQEQEPTPNYSK